MRSQSRDDREGVRDLVYHHKELVERVESQSRDDREGVRDVVTCAFIFFTLMARLNPVMTGRAFATRRRLAFVERIGRGGLNPVMTGRAFAT